MKPNPFLDRRSRASFALLAGLVPFVIAACSSGGDDDGLALFDPQSTKVAVQSTAIVAVDDRYLLFQADEATTGDTVGGGTNLNAANTDADATDQIAVYVNMASDKETRLNVAAEELALVGRHAYMAVSEANDSFDWNQDGDTLDYVLTHYPKDGASVNTSSPAAPDVEYVDDLEAAGRTHLLSVDGRLYYTRSDATSTVGSETTLAYLDPTDPTTPVPVTILAGSTIQPRMLGVDGDLIFLYGDEGQEGVDLNGDADTDDQFVLALLDGTDPAAVILEVGLAVENEDAPFRANQVSSTDWVVAFLVDEASHVDFPNGLNDPSNVALGFQATWLPSNCATFDDVDTTDQVLHFLTFEDWAADPIGNPVQNTGLAGQNRVVATDTAVATITNEVNEGLPACDLNDNGETDDDIVRWCRISSPKVPFVDADHLVAVTNVPGGTFGLTDLDGQLVAVVDEANSVFPGQADGPDGDATDNDLIGFIDPDDYGDTWLYDHSTSATLFFGSTWMGDSSRRDLVRTTFTEAVFQQDTSGDTLGNGDGDTADTLGGTANFGSANDLDFGWPRVGMSSNNAGIDIFNNVMFFRVDEVTDERDWNNDGDTGDRVLARTATNGANFLRLGTSNDIIGRMAVEGGGDVGVAWIADEAQDDRDYDKDGDNDELVLRWCRIGS